MLASLHHCYFSCCCLLFAGLLAQVSGQLQVTSTGDTPRPFSNPNRITVGFTSDLIVQVQCSFQNASSATGNVQWTYAVNGSEVDDGLRAFGTSQENGVLRVYPASLLSGDGAVFQCSDGSSVLNVTFELQDDLFFLNPIPSTASVFADRIELCAVPDIPTPNNITIVEMTNSQTGNDYFYCLVETERGTFRSRSVISLPAPRFFYEPVNVTARPVNGTASAAFSCAISPTSDLVEIQWSFEMMSFGSGSGSGSEIGPGLPSGLLSNTTEGVTIHQPVDSGTSILILESVGNGYEGLYSCVAVFSNGTRITSSEAALIFDRTSLGDNDVIILAPPTTLSVTEGDAVSLPCVGSGGTPPLFVVNGTAVQSPAFSGPYSLDFASIAISDAGTYTCQIGYTNATVAVNVSAMLDRPLLDNISVAGTGFTAELGVPSGTNVFISCTSPNLMAAMISWLNDARPAASAIGNNLRLNPVSEGIYQCLGQFSGPAPSETDLTGELGNNVYVLVQSVSIPAISAATNLDSFVFGRDEIANFSCSVNGNPLPQLIWGVDNVPVDGTQAATGFREMASSTLGVNITELGIGTHSIQCNASVANLLESTTINITVQAVLQNISVSPEVQNFTLDSNLNDTVTLVCSVEANPGPPRIEWLRNNDNVTSQADAVALVESITYSSMLTLQIEQLERGENVFTCLAFQDAETPPTVINDTAVVNVFVAPNFTVNPQDLLAVVGDIVSLNCSAQAMPLPSITWEYGNGTAIADDDLFNISFSFEGDVTTSVLSFVGEETSATSPSLTFRCVAANGVGNDTSDTAAVTIQSLPVFVVNPESDIVVVGDQVTLICSALATPNTPNITWFDRDGMEVTADSTFTINEDLSELGDVRRSYLSFTASAAGNRTGNGSSFQCEATVQLDAINVTLRNQSEVATITIAGVPGSPAPVAASDVTSRTAVVTWQLPFSLIDVANYSVTITELLSPELDAAAPMVISVSNSTTVNLTRTELRPNRQYNVSVVGYNRAGRGEEAVSDTFSTLEDVPDGAPNISSVSSTVLRQIDLSWTTVDPNLQNGVITNYTVRYWIVGNENNALTRTVPGLTIVLTSGDQIEAGRMYVITVAANTQIGSGVPSTEIMQATIVEPIDIATQAQPITVNTNAIALTSIPITLPSIPGATSDSFSHFWVVAMKIDDAFAERIRRQDGTVPFSDNSSFTMYSDTIPANTPYIVAEIAASSLTLSSQTNFILGDEASTMFLNDQPTLYQNGPLTQGTQYTAFLWGFSPNVADGQIQKRQTSSLQRQYVVFSSSRFLSPVFTLSPASDLSGGAIAAIVIITLLATAVLVFLVIAAVFYMRWRMRNVDLPPPSRKGSMRLRDRREVIQSTATASLIKNHRAESELQRLTPDDVRLPVTVEDFPGYCKLMHANSDHLFSEEYEILTIKSPSLPHLQCSMPHNVHKNRYANINCYDDSRVHLSVVPGMEGSDYINANYVDGYQRKSAYIATQGPLANTTYDFWRMVWEANSCCIIMLTNLVEKSRAKCHQYWPEVGSVNLGDLTVTIIEIQQLAYYTIRTFRMSRGNDRREVKQFHYTGWPDFGVPDHPNPVIAFIRRLANFKRTTDGPDIIHCSAGVGRTGTLIGIQCMLQMMNEEGKIDIFNFVLGMRRQRNYMVQTERQYIFLHDAMLELIKVGDTEIPIQSLRRRYKEFQSQDPDTESSKMEAEFAQLNELQNVDQSQFQAAKMTVNLPKNRFQDILPYERYRVRLLLHPGVSGSDYMNASYIDGYQKRHQYIVTQGPLKDTVDDFWRMVWEHKASTIMMLCQLEEKGKEQCVRYWPSDKIRQHGDMFVELTQIAEYATYTMREFSITNTKINESRSIKQYQYTDWLEDRNPSNASAIIDLIGVLQKSQHTNGGGPIIVHDSTSIGRSGTFCVMSSILEQLKVEGVVDIFFTIHSLRQQQPGLVQTFEQYKFCYQAVMEFLDSFDIYSNFD